MRRKLIAIVLSFIFILLFSGCSKSNESDTIKVGVAGVISIEKCQEYLETQFPEWKFEVLELGSENDDGFNSVYNNIEKYISEGKIDMIIGVPEGYITQQKKCLFQNLYSNLDTSNFIPAVINHCKSDNSKEMMYVTHTFYCTRFLTINKTLVNSLGVEIPVYFDGIEEVIDLSYIISKEIENKSKNSCFSVSMGSPIDEFLYDDLANILLPMGFPRTETGLQKRYYNDEYLGIYKKLYMCALDNSYSREEIGYKYPLDYYFSTGNVALKMSTVFELSAFKTQQQDSPFDTQITDFDYGIVPVSRILNTQSTVSAIAFNSKHTEKCYTILRYLSSENYALDIIENTSPFLIDTCSLPCVSFDSIEQSVQEKYGVDSLTMYCDYTTFEFVMNSKTHWNVIEQERSCFYDNSQVNADKLISKLKKINQ